MTAGTDRLLLRPRLRRTRRRRALSQRARRLRRLPPLSGIDGDRRPACCSPYGPINVAGVSLLSESLRPASRNGTRLQFATRSGSGPRLSSSQVAPPLLAARARELRRGRPTADEPDRASIDDEETAGHRVPSPLLLSVRGAWADGTSRDRSAATPRRTCARAAIPRTHSRQPPLSARCSTATASAVIASRREDRRTGTRAQADARRSRSGTRERASAPNGSSWCGSCGPACAARSVAAARIRRHDGFITYLEERDSIARQPRRAPPPGLHRLNRTEYANVGARHPRPRYRSGCSILPSDDSTHGFDNIAGALGISSTLVEAYVCGRRKDQPAWRSVEPTTPALVVYRTPEDTSQDYHIEGLPFGTARGHARQARVPVGWRVSPSPSRPIFGDNMSPTGFGSVPCEARSRCSTASACRSWTGSAAARHRQRRKPIVRAMPPRGRSAARRGAGGGRGAAAGGARSRASRRRTAGPEAFSAAGRHADARRASATTAGAPLDRRHLPRHEFRAGAGPRSALHARHGADRADAGIRRSSPRRHGAHRRPVQRRRPPKESPMPRAAHFRVPPGRRRGRGSLRCAKIVTKPRRRVRSDVRPPAPTSNALDGRSTRRAARKATSSTASDMVLARVLADPRVHLSHRNRAGGGQAGTSRYRITRSRARVAIVASSSGAASRTTSCITVARARAELKDPVVLERQVRRMLKDSRAQALHRQLRGAVAEPARPAERRALCRMVYPDFDDPLRQAMRREVELLFDSIVREDRSVMDLLAADYTFVNERLAKHYGIPNIYGSQFRRVTLGADMDARRGLLGKGAFLTTTSKPRDARRRSRAANGSWRNILGVSPPDPPARRAAASAAHRRRLPGTPPSRRCARRCWPIACGTIASVPQPDGSDRVLARELRWGSVSLARH